MVDIVKPDISSVWAEAGAVIAPSNEKIKLGWTSEVPPHQYENFVQNRQDEMLAYLNQKGVPEWRTGTEYFLGKSFVQDAGKIYKANKNSGGLLPNQKPSTDATNEYWEQATFSLSDLKQAVGTSTKDVMSQKAVTDALINKVDKGAAATESVLGLVQLATTAEAQALTNDTDALTPAKLAGAFGGANQGLTANGYQKLPGGLIIQWGISASISSGSLQTITLPITFNNGILCLYTTLFGGIPNNSYTSAVSAISASQFSIGNHSSTGLAGNYNWLAIGY